MKKRLTFLCAAAQFALLIVFSAEARLGAENGLQLWGGLLVPSLLPFFAVSGLLSRLGFVDAVGRWVAAPAKKLLGLSDAGCAVFLLGLSGGYPLGASAAADAVRRGALSPEEAGRLLRFCDNTGPAFAVGALGVGVFGSARTGLALWGIHALSAVMLAIIYRNGTSGSAECLHSTQDISFSEALTGSLAAAVSALLNIGGYVVFFSSLLAVGERLGFPGAPARLAAHLTGLSPAFCRALFCGALELSSGIGALHALPLDAAAFSLSAFLLSWGGLCVHAQSAAVTAGTGISLAGRLRGKLLHGLLSAGIALLVSPYIL